MAAKRSISPGPIDLMKDILKLIAEPNSGNNKKKLEVAYVQQPAQTSDPTNCTDCCNSTGFVCSAKYHKFPNFVRKFEGIGISIGKIFDFTCLPFEPFLEEVSIQRKYNVKLPARKQLDKLKMIRKNDRCVICKRGVLQGRLVQCNYCTRLFHLNCLDPPIRDWDHSMRWVCPEHEEFLALLYPGIFSPGHVVNNGITTKRMRCQLPSIPVNKFFNIPSHIEAMYKKPEENISTTSTENSSLNILCDVASFALESINSKHKINKSNENFISQISNYLLPPTEINATLSCLSFPFNISVQKKEITIGNSHKNDVCLLPYGHCEYISSYHATINFDENSGDFVLKNLSRFGIIVDNVSYFGNRRRPKDPSNNHELKKVNSGVRKYINKLRKTVQKNKIIVINQNSDDEKPIIKYASKTREFNYKPMSKYYKSKFKNIQHGYHKVQCKCSKRLIQKDGYSGIAILRNESIILIGCMKFIFTYNAGIIETRRGSTDKSPSKNEGTRLKILFDQENSINLLTGTNNDLDSVSIYDVSLQDADDTSSINEQNNTDKLDLNDTGHGGLYVGGESENIPFDNDDVQAEDYETSDTECTKQWNTTNAVPRKMQSCFASDLIQEVEVIESSEDSEIIEEEVVYEMNYSETDNSALARNSDDQEWIIEEEEVVIEEDRNYNDNKPGVDQQLTSRDYKTEHMYCARSPLYDDPIIISDDDEENVNDETDSDI